MKDEEDKIFKDVKPVGLFSLFQFAESIEICMLMVAFLIAGAAGAATPCMSIAMEGFMNQIGSSNADFLPAIRLYIYLGIGTFFGCGIYSYIFEIVAERMLVRCKKKFFNSLSRQDIAWYDVSDPAQFASRVTEELSIFREGCGVKFAQVLQLTSTILTGYILGLVKAPILALVIIATFPAMMIAGAFFGTALTEALVGSTDAHGEAGAVAEEALANIRTVQAFGQEEEFTKRYDALLGKAARFTRMGGIKFGVSLGVLFFVMYATFALGYWYGGKLIADHYGEPNTSWTPGRVMSVFFAVSLGSMSFGSLANPAKSVAKAMAALGKILQVIDRKPEGIDSLSIDGDRPEKDSLKGEVNFSNIQFSFPSRQDKPIYKSLSFTLPAGKTTALVGASGAGKSSAAQLLMRYYDPQEGVIAIDGIDLKSINPGHWRSIVGIVAQEPKLFATTIKENIKIGMQNATEEEIIAAAVAANAHDFIMQFPDGYDTDVGQSGSQLSGGQKQRIAIARTIIKNPKVLILDEATSALDNHSEKVVQKALDDLMARQPRTTLVIAHRLTTIRNADKIVVLCPTPEGSIIAEEGNHNELMNIEGGVYRNLVETHQEPEESDNQLKNNQTSYNIAATVTNEIVRRISSHTVAAVSNVGANSISRSTSFDVPNSLKISKFAENTKQVKTNDIDRDSYTVKYLYSKTINLISSQWIFVLIGTFAAGIRGASNPVFGLMIGEMMTVFFEPTAQDVRDGVNKWGLLITILALIQIPAMTISSTCYGRLEAYLTQKARRMYFNALLYQDGEFFDAPNRTTGSLIAALTAQTQLLKALIADSFMLACENVVSLIVALSLSFSVSWKMALVMLAAYCIIIPGFAMEAKYQILDQAAEDAREAAKETTKANSAGHLLNELVTSIRIVHALNAELVLGDKYNYRLYTALKKGMLSAWKYAFGASLANSSIHFTSAIAFGAGSVFINDGTVPFGSVFKVFSIMLMAGQGLGMATVFAKDQVKGIDAARDIFAVTERTHEADVRKSCQLSNNKVDLDGARIHFENVKFFYPTRNNSRVYNGISFTLEPGQTTALVGASGSGKSTVVQLLQRYYSLIQGKSSVIDDSIVCGGRIIIEQKNGKKIDLIDIPIHEWRSLIGMVGQEPCLFEGSISNNIALGSAKDNFITDESIMHAAHLANATEFLPRLADGINTDVGRSGGKLSGGQKQRVAIARALVRDPKILILDEATSALDNESEKVVQKALDDLLEKQEEKRTTLVIAHRLTTIRHADKIVVFKPSHEGSTIAEVGSHEELMKLQGIYFKLVKSAETLEEKNMGIANVEK